MPKFLDVTSLSAAWSRLGQVPAENLPSYVDDVLEFNNQAAFPATGETGKIYVDKSSGDSFRWTGSVYIRISDKVLAAGITDSGTAGRAVVRSETTATARAAIGSERQRVFNILDYGASTTGTAAANTTAIHATRDAAGVGGTVYFPPGSYATQSLYPNVAGQTWNIESATLAYAGTGTLDCIRITAPDVTVLGGTIDMSAIAPLLTPILQPQGMGIFIDGHNNAAGANGAAIRDVTIKNSAYHGIYGRGVENVTVSDCAIIGQLGHGIAFQIWTPGVGGAPSYALQRCSNFLIENNVISTDSPHTTAIYFRASNNSTQQFYRVKVANNTVVMPIGRPSDAESVASWYKMANGIDLWYCSDSVVDSNTISGGWVSISSPFLTNVTISNNVCSAFWGMGIEIPLDQINTTVTGNVITTDGGLADGCWANLSGIQCSSSVTALSPVENMVIANNTITGFDTDTYARAIWFVNRLSITGLVISSNSISASNAAASFNAIQIDSKSSNTLISGNSVDNSSRPSSRGVLLQNTEQVGAAIVGNNFANCAESAINLSTLGNGSFTDIRITGNLIRNCGTSVTGDGIVAATRLVMDGGVPLTSTVTAGTTTTLTVSSTEGQLFTGTSSHTVKLPTTGVVAGRQFRIINSSTGVVTVTASNNSTIAAIPAGGSSMFVSLQATPTASTHWANSLAHLGTPTSLTLTNATGLPIAGLVSSTSTALGLGSIDLGHATDTTVERVSAGVISVEGVTLKTVAPVESLTSSRTLDAVAGREYTVMIGASGAPTLPTAASNTSMYHLKNVDTSNKTVATTSSQTISNSTTYILIPGASITVVSDGSNWRII